MEEHGLAPAQRRDVLLSVGAVAALSLLAWLALVRMARSMAATDTMAAMGMPSSSPWAAADLLQLWVMWAVMMAAMMLPSTIPVVLLFARVGRQREARGEPAPRLLLLLAGYLVVWIGFSLVAALAQQALRTAALITPAMAFGRPVVAACLLFTAAAYQWSPPKQACLRVCRSPLSMFISEWREGWTGALRMGARHGMFCVACCWLLMLLLFVAGVMNLAWVGVLAALVLVERTLPGGAWLGRVAGIGFVLWGAWLLLRTS